MKNIRKQLTALLVICLVLVQTAWAAPAEAAEAGQEHEQEQEQATVHFGTGEKNGFRSDEPASVTLTAQVPKDGTYLLDFYAEGAYGSPDAAPVAVSSPDEALAVLDDRESYGDARGGVFCLVELTAGEYTVQVENTCFVSADLTLVYPLESVLGHIEPGAYVGTLDEAMTVSYTLTGTNARAEIYNGPADGMQNIGSLLARDGEDTGEPDTAQTSVSFEPGTVVIDYRDSGKDGSLEGAGADASTNEAAVLKGEPIEFVDPSDEDGVGISASPGDEPATGTAAIQGDGYYFLDVDVHYYLDKATFTFSSDIPALPDFAAVPDWATAYDDFVGTDETRIYMVSDMTSGEYSITVGSVLCDASFFPLQTADSLTGEFDSRGMYVCFLDEPASVTFTMSADDAGWVHFYGGVEEDGFLQDLTPDVDAASGGSVTVQFPAGAAVIDTHLCRGSTITGVQN